MPGEKGPQDACGVFGVWAPGEEVAKLAYFGLYALQHRGQESAGIAASNGQQILVYKDMGLVSQVFDETNLNALTGHLAVGHCRYSTTGGVTWENAQPTLGATATGTVALGHNGNLVNSAELVELVEDRYGAQRRGELARGNTTDTALVTALLHGDTDHSLEDTALEVLPRLRGAFSLVFMDETTLYAARDPQGVRPLVLGRLDRGWVVASENPALDIVGASYVREVEPGELIIINESGLRSVRFAEENVPGVSSNTSTSPALTPPFQDVPCMQHGWTWDASSPKNTPWRLTWSSRFPNQVHPQRWGMPKNQGSPSGKVSPKTLTWAAPSSSPQIPCGN